MSGSELRTKRAGFRIDGHTICARLKRGRSWLSDVENERVQVELAELQRINSAIDSIVAERAKIAQLAAEHGLSLAGVGL